MSIESVHLLNPISVKGHHDGMRATVLSTGRGYELREATGGVSVSWTHDKKQRRAFVPLGNIAAIHFAPDALEEKKPEAKK